jgi:hypothetical protein
MTDLRTDDATLTESERVRGEIDDTREHLGQTVDAIGDRVLPGRIIERRKESTAQTLRGWKDRLMGAADDTTHQLAGTASSKVDQVRGAPQSLAHRTEGSPLAVGGVAFAIGVLAAAVWRPTQPERQMIERVTDAAPELTNQVTEMAQEAAESLKGEAADAANEVRSSVTEAATATKAAATGD